MDKQRGGHLRTEKRELGPDSAPQDHGSQSSPTQGNRGQMHQGARCARVGGLAWGLPGLVPPRESLRTWGLWERCRAEAREAGLFPERLQVLAKVCGLGRGVGTKRVPSRPHQAPQLLPPSPRAPLSPPGLSPVLSPAHGYLPQGALPGQCRSQRCLMLPTASCLASSTRRRQGLPGAPAVVPPLRPPHHVDRQVMTEGQVPEGSQPLVIRGPTTHRRHDL